MASIVMVIGQSGTGKSTSLRNFKKGEASDQKAGFLPHPRRPDADRGIKTGLRKAAATTPCRSLSPHFPGKVPITRNNPWGNFCLTTTNTRITEAAIFLESSLVPLKFRHF